MLKYLQDFMMTEFVPITRYSRCKRYSGAIIKCPECNSLGQVYHLSWSALQCQNCKKMVDKFDWFIEKSIHYTNISIYNIIIYI